MSPAPTCYFCGKPLRPDYETKQVRVETPNKLGGTTYERAVGPHGRTMTVTIPPVDVRIETIKTGKILGYGYLNNGLFCMQRCGFDWAVAQLRASALQLTETP